ncbi:MAG: 6-phosphofructokinase [Candidatus Omnitrophica bacterium]|nr:6-phosphofructokinase [Candidatus Omnitrophota bacterium]MDE2008874.1 6-phosphofructokinase [Candidatus Omnitrophota bacterium]MDE2213563.1 6-phosphofructokinase [Candidatus Omnitrophota bacterium]MDE2230536.1 6-phosphofructokinase [Candidatus Omnitrophota bacterium]
MKRIGIITSGGDCGGLNGVIKGAANMALSHGATCFIIPSGYAGLYNLVDFNKLTELTHERLDRINANLAGSEAGHSRVKIKKIDDPEKYQRIKKGLEKFKLDGLIISGGDDSGSVMVDLTEHGIKCVHAPKTMDMDLQTYSVGADSSINRIAEFVEDLKTTAATHQRILAMEVFGRYVGHTAFRGGIAADADAIIIPEIPCDFDILYKHMKDRYFKRIMNTDVRSGTYLIVVAEGIKNASGEDIVDENAPVDAFGHKRLAGAGNYVCQQLIKRLKNDASIPDLMRKTGVYVKGISEIPEVRAVMPGHLVRCGHSSAYDVNFGKEAGAAAFILLNQGISGVTVAGISNGRIRYIDTKEAIRQRLVDLDQVAIYEQLGTCFGRVPQKLQAQAEKLTQAVERHW